jgi:predicted DNA-binding transcriptional regulator YafY
MDTLLLLTPLCQERILRRAERLFRLIALLRSQSISRADDLAEQLEVSVRTIYRDIAHVQASGVPIDGEPGVGYMLRPGFDLPPMTMTVDQISAVAIGLKFVIEAADEELAYSAKEVRDKLSSTLPAEASELLQAAPFFVARNATRPPSFTPMIRKAIQQRELLKILYKTPDKTRCEREIEPLSLTVFTEGWMIGAWCRLRQDFRYFRLDRIIHIESMPERFVDDPQRNLKALRKVKH